MSSPPTSSFLAPTELAVGFIFGELSPVGTGIAVFNGNLSKIKKVSPKVGRKPIASVLNSTIAYNGSSRLHRCFAVASTNLAFVNIRFVGVGFRAYVVKKFFEKSNDTQPKLDSVAPNLGAEAIGDKKGLGTASGAGFQSLRDAKPIEHSCFEQNNARFLHEEEGKKAFRFLMLKVGQSALTAYPIPKGIGVYCPKDQQADKDAILLTGNNLQELKQITAEIKSYKTPDPYKGSGIYQSQRIETDEGEIFENEKVFRKVMKKK